MAAAIALACINAVTIVVGQCDIGQRNHPVDVISQLHNIGCSANVSSLFVSDNEYHIRIGCRDGTSLCCNSSTSQVNGCGSNGAQLALVRAIDSLRDGNQALSIF